MQPKPFMNDCVFCRIIEKIAPAEIIFEDEFAIVIQNIKPLTPVHLLILPRNHYRSMNDLTAADAAFAGHLLLTACRMAEFKGIRDSGYRVAINTGSQGGQTVFHLHLHLMGGKPLPEGLLTQGLE
ncbi:MAG: histidine triad nucleotide-binding protein [Chloroflexi bacterium]|nr:histidine triad nucleotide-binding protein [Chloroflexota bacterium]